jgi:NAD+ kinase
MHRSHKHRKVVVMLQRIGVLAHPLRPPSSPLAQRIAESLRAHAIEASLHLDWDETSIHSHINGLDMVIAIGGDGAMLRAARVSAAYNVPVLGINMGRLGFLTEIHEPDDWESHIPALLEGKYWIEQRMMLRVTVLRGASVICTSDALNDLVISRNTITRMIQLDAYIDGGWTTTYNADALIIATATGSTAYALASGGPILPPELRNILLIPVAPHLSLDRPIVLQEGADVDVVIATETDTALSADGALIAELQMEDRVSVQASERIARFVRLRERNYFYRSLLDRLEPRIPLHNKKNLR